MAKKITQYEFNLAPERKIWNVTELTSQINNLLAAQFSNIWVEGEISNCRIAQSGHIYFTLKDDKAQVKCICFRSQAIRLKFRPEDGLRVVLRGAIGVFETRGEYQIYVEHIAPAGLGELQVAFDQLKARLQAEGLFEDARKKPLPVLPGRIGLVTSPDGDAVRDMIRVLRRRFATLRLVLYPVRVQGEGAAQDIAAALRYFGQKQIADVILLGRGGGSIEDLWAFNEETVARAIAGCPIPVVSGIGHEADFTIADFVADVRASTPSAAAEIVVRARAEFDRQLAEVDQRMSRRIHYLLLQRHHRLKALTTHIGFRRLENLMRRHRQRNDELAASLSAALAARIARMRHRHTIASTRIASYDLSAKMRAVGARLDQQSAALGVHMMAILRNRRERTGANAVALADKLSARLERLQQRHAIAETRMTSFDLRSRLTVRSVRVLNGTAAMAGYMKAILVGKTRRLERLNVQLQERSPLRLLERGYAVCTDAAGNVLTAAQQVALGDDINVQLARGQLGARVTRRT